MINFTLFISFHYSCIEGIIILGGVWALLSSIHITDFGDAVWNIQFKLFSFFVLQFVIKKLYLNIVYILILKLWFPLLGNIPFILSVLVLFSIN